MMSRDWNPCLIRSLIHSAVLTGVNYTNTLKAAFEPIFLFQKSKNLKCKHTKATNETFVQKTARKMSVKLTSGFKSYFD